MDVQYFELEGLPGRQFFRCEKRMATLQADSCKLLWHEGNQKSCHERYWACRGCAIGAKHAGAAEATLSPFYMAPICARCGAGSTRLIGGHLCVSCQNRQYEYVKGRNAKGKVPITHPTLYRLSLRYWTGGRVKTMTRANSVNSLELLVAALRDEPKQCTFTVSPPPKSPLPQMELFA